MLLASRAQALSSFFSSFGGKPKVASPPAATGAGAAPAAALSDEALARQLQGEWESEAAGGAASVSIAAGAKPPKTPATAAAAAKTVEPKLPPSSFGSHLLMRYAVHAAGWRRVYARLHGSSFTIYAAESSRTAESAVEVKGCALSELEAKGGMFTKKNIFRFGIIDAKDKGSKGKEAAEATWAAESDDERGLWMAHLILAGADRPEPGLLCRCMQPLLQGAPSATRAGGLKALADVLKQMVAAGETAVIAAAMLESGVLANVIHCLEAAPGQEHAARICFYMGAHTECQRALLEAGAVESLLDLLTTPEDQLQTWCASLLPSCAR
jgi:hypothetical protein